MFDIGFAELLLVAVVGLLVLGPERLPEAIRTGAAWLNRLRRGFNDIKREIQQELHNDAIMRELRDTGRQLTQDTAPPGAAPGTTPAAAAADGVSTAPSQVAADTPAAAQERTLPGGVPGNAPATGSGPTPSDGDPRTPERDAG